MVRMLVLSAALLSAFAPSPLWRDKGLLPQGIDAPRISQKDFKKQGRMSWHEESEQVVATEPDILPIDEVRS